MANLSNINNKFLVTTGGNVLIGQTGAVGSSIFQVTGASTFTGNILMGNTVTNPASGFADQTGIGLKYSTTVPTIEVSSDSSAMQLGRSSTGGEGQILGLRKAGTIIHNFDTNNVSIGTNATFAGNVIISGTLTIGGNSAITRSGSTAQGRLAIWQNDTAIKGNNNLFYASQYLTVGVGTTGGYAGLRINASSVGELYLDFTEGASFTKRAQIQVDTNDNMYFRNTSSNSLRMTLLSGGNFGIGTTSPSTKLDVRGGSGGGSFDHATFTSVTNRGLKISTANSSEGQNGAAVIYNAQDGENYGSHAFQVGGSTKMFIKGNNVGIGTDGPSEILHLNAPGTGCFIRFQNTGGSGVYIGGRSEVMEMYTNASEKMRITSDGNVGINLQNLTFGGFSPKLALKQTSDVVWGGINIESAVDDSLLALGNDGGRHQIAGSYRATAGYKPIDIMTSGSIRMTVLAGGNVGIGTTSPITKLSVHNSTETTGITDVLTVTCATTNTASAGKGAAIRIGRDPDGNYSTKIATVYEQNNPSYLNPAMVFYTMYNSYLKGSEVERMRITSTGSIFMLGLGGYTSSNADVRFSTASGELYYQTSSKRYKTDIVNLENSLDKINSLRPVRYKDINTGESACGLIAEETVEIIPEVVFTKKIEGFNEPQIEGINYSDIVPLLIKAIQELEARVKELENK